MTEESGERRPQSKSPHQEFSKELGLKRTREAANGSPPYTGDSASPQKISQRIGTGVSTLDADVGKGEGETFAKTGASKDGVSQEFSRGFLHMNDDGADEFYLLAPDTPLLQRMDRLDHILSALEDKSGALSPATGPSSGPPTPSSLEKRYIPAESVLEEIEQKGTLVERVSCLEKRVLTLGKAFQRILSSELGSSQLARPLVTLLSPPCKDKDGHTLSSDQPPGVHEKHELLPQNEAGTPCLDAESESSKKSTIGDKEHQEARMASAEAEYKTAEEGIGSEAVTPWQPETVPAQKEKKKGSHFRKVRSWFLRPFCKASDSSADKDGSPCMDNESETNTV